MIAKVIQGSFFDGRPKLPPPVAARVPPPPPPIQAKTAARPPGPPAPAVFGRPLGPPAPAFGGRPPGLPTPAFGGRAGAVQRHGRGGAFAVEPGQVGLASSGGRPLPEAVRGKMEAALGADFSDVRVHVGPQAERIGAIAFTLGSDVYFAPGRFQPDTAHGQQLLGHELAHVVQQRAGRVRNPLGSGIAVVQDHALEAEADRLGRHAAAHRVAAQPKMPPGAAQPSAPVRISPPVSAGPGGYRLTAGAAGRQVGSVIVHARDRGAVEITDLGVDQSQRGHGIGQMLVASAAKTGLQFGRSKVTLAAQDKGSGHLTRWYKEMGFTQVGINRFGYPQLEAPINRLVGASAQRKPFPRGFSTLQAMESVTPEVGDRRRNWVEVKRQSFGRNVAVMKLELAGSGHERWHYRDEPGERGLEPLPHDQADLKHRPTQIVETRIKHDKKRETYSIAGPLALSGASDSGPNSIANNVISAQKLIDNFVQCHSKAARIVILIKAHSRNAVAGIQIANYVENFYGPESLPPVSAELVAFDPVPGPGQPQDYHETILVQTMARSTVVYSAETQYSHFFEPQRVYGAQRVIISSKNHGVGYTDGVIFKGSLYKGSRIGLLPPGFYINTGLPPDQTEPERIWKCQNFEDVSSYLVCQDWALSNTQRGRLIVIWKVAAVWFRVQETLESWLIENNPVKRAKKLAKNKIYEHY